MNTHRPSVGSILKGKLRAFGQQSAGGGGGIQCSTQSYCILRVYKQTLSSVGPVDKQLSCPPLITGLTLIEGE